MELTRLESGAGYGPVRRASGPLVLGRMCCQARRPREYRVKNAPSGIASALWTRALSSWSPRYGIG